MPSVSHQQRPLASTPTPSSVENNAIGESRYGRVGSGPAMMDIPHGKVFPTSSDLEKTRQATGIARLGIWHSAAQPPTTAKGQSKLTRSSSAQPVHQDGREAKNSRDVLGLKAMFLPRKGRSRRWLFKGRGDREEVGWGEDGSLDGSKQAVEVQVTGEHGHHGCERCDPSEVKGSPSLRRRESAAADSAIESEYHDSETSWGSWDESHVVESAVFYHHATPIMPPLLAGAQVKGSCCTPAHALPPIAASTTSSNKPPAPPSTFTISRRGTSSSSASSFHTVVTPKQVRFSPVVAVQRLPPARGKTWKVLERQLEDLTGLFPEFPRSQVLAHARYNVRGLRWDHKDGEVVIGERDSHGYGTRRPWDEDQCEACADGENSAGDVEGDRDPDMEEDEFSEKLALAEVFEDKKRARVFLVISEPSSATPTLPPGGVPTDKLWTKALPGSPLTKAAPASTLPPHTSPPPPAPPSSSSSSCSHTTRSSLPRCQRRGLTKPLGATYGSYLKASSTTNMRHRLMTRALSGGLAGEGLVVSKSCLRKGR